VVLAAAGAAARLRAGHPAAAPVERSIAVLPFEDRGAERDAAYFADGVTDEILLALAAVGDLRVISRTSVERYRGSDRSAREIGRELGAGYVLEGSVRRAAERVRISAELIDAGSDRYVWARSFDRPMRDIFAVQSEIARDIARALDARLSEGELARSDRAPTTSLEAHDYLLQARAMVGHDVQPDLDAGIELLRRARALDPGYPDVHSWLAWGLALRYMHEGLRSDLDSAVVAGREAVRLDPDFAPGHVRLGMVLNYRGDREAALAEQRRAVELDPGASDGLANLYAYDFGSLDEAARHWLPALRADPTSSMLNWQVGRNYQQLGMPERARPLLERSVAFNPRYLPAHYALLSTLVLQGRAGEVRAGIERMLAANGSSPSALFFAGLAAAQIGDLAAARRYLEEGETGRWIFWDAQGALTLAWILQRSGEEERARALIRRAAEEFDRWSGGRPRRPEDYVNLARVRVLQGERAEAVRQMELAVSHGWRLLHDQPGDPILGSLRGDPGYDRLVSRVSDEVERQRARVVREGW
jgi:TolB-like protein/Tfp pilus assembly protein PilF